MAVTHGTATRTAVADTVVDRVDLGSGLSAGYLEITTSGNSVLVTCSFSTTAFGSASSGTATANAISNGTASAAGTAAKAKVKDKDGNVIFEGTVTATGGGGNVELATTSITVGMVVSVSACTYVAPS